MINRIRKVVENNPKNIAYYIDNNCITYKELWEKSLLYSDYLKRLEAKPVVLYGHKEINMIIGMLSCILSGTPYIPIQKGTPVERIKEIMNISNSDLIISDYDIEGLNTIKIEELNKYKDNPIIEERSNIVYIIFTSGSTGKPKGVPISIGNLYNFVDWISNNEVLKEYKDINVLNNASYSFDLSVTDLFYSLCNGHTLNAYSFNLLEETDKIYDVYRERHINLSVMTPTTIKLCLLDSDFNSEKYSDLDCIYFCGEQLEPSIVNKIFDRFPNIKILNAYGPTEATSAVTMIKITRDMTENKYLPVGEIDKSAVDIELIDGEILLKGKSVFNGYLSLDSENFYKEGNNNCYLTGDYGIIEDNLLFCLGRKDYQIKYKGYRIELGEIEYNIKNIVGIEDAAVVAKTNDQNIVSSIKAFVVSDLEEEFIKNELKKVIPFYMIPKTIIKIDKLPVNKNGKIDRKELMNL